MTDSEFLRELAHHSHGDISKSAADRLQQIADRLEPKPAMETRFVTQVPKDGPLGPTPADQSLESHKLRSLKNTPKG